MSHWGDKGEGGRGRIGGTRGSHWGDKGVGGGGNNKGVGIVATQIEKKMSRNGVCLAGKSFPLFL